MNSVVPLSFDHRYIAGDGAQAGLTLFLLHGTGGDGDSLLQLGYTLAPGATLLSPTGKVREGEFARFFRRVADGVLDQEDLAFRTTELTDFLRDAVTAYDLDARRVVAVGFSNGANIAASILLREPYMLAGAILLRPMLPFTPETTVKLHRMPVLVCAGTVDTITPRNDPERLTALLMAGDADVTFHSEPTGHELAMGDIVAAKNWLVRYFTPK